MKQGDEHRRIYDHVFDTPPGQQMLIDFGEETLSQNKSIHFICLLLRYSRLLCVYAQDHKFNATEACTAIYRCFCKIGGRPKELVIDQDAVFITSETYGEVIESRVFKEFCTEQDLRLWVCNKADPESKGPIENSVGFVKKNFFSARKITCVDDVNRSLPGWLERKNHRVHKATFRVPQVVFDSFEKEALRPLLPSVFETSPNSFRTCQLKSMPYVQYKTNHYSVPREYAYQTVKFKVIGDKLHIYDNNLQWICTHTLSECQGIYAQLPEHKKKEPEDWVAVMERLRAKWNCYDFQHFINGVKKENPRHIAKQLRAIEEYLDKEAPERAFVAEVLEVCCENFRYKYSQFKAVFELMKASRDPVPIDLYEKSDAGNVAYVDLSEYASAFAERSYNAGESL